ncbi:MULTISPECIES: stage V sporulation protein AD [Tissierellales]|jgi:stage V sporulation protein AD|uniref:Stage V sporulation protein AD n=1 Tax=Acidilutibacter cellobiosedens TaxID=2507161 RepID=A0A410QDQ6_9FIRM|nr:MULTISPECIES: stage V sporulation protein AD [Tissierellales]QAT62115.1 stage V sporulation protein AD [Acidilutibacter cellobiosedens]SCL84636.1 Stage V sporulation protein AD [Sporanaerobacter sp. PP17-6a]
MENKRMGKRTIKLVNSPSIINTATIVGPKEGDGPLREYFDIILEDDLWEQESWEKCEKKMQEEAIRLVLTKANLTENEIDYLFSGDLLNQIISSAYAARQISIPFFGLYGACSTMSESLSLGAMLIDGGFANNIICSTSSHFSTAERQYRFPLEYGSQRPFSSQWTVTGCGASLLSSSGEGPYINYVTTGKVIDPGINDVNNMGAAMAPAAVDTIMQHFKDTGFNPDDYDMILTGDLGAVGKSVLLDIMDSQGYDLSKVYDDCGMKIFDNLRQDVHAGASGCGCSASVFNGYIYSELKSRNIDKLLLVSTGALHSSTSTLQGETIPGIAHAVSISNFKN